VRSEQFTLRRLSGTGHLDLIAENRLRALTVLAGRARLDDGSTQSVLMSGQTAALPACLGPLRIELEAAHAVLAALA
jgi:mannose-6-phosphate isomerase class I